MKIGIFRITIDRERFREIWAIKFFKLRTVNKRLVAPACMHEWNTKIKKIT